MWRVEFNHEDGEGHLDDRRVVEILRAFGFTSVHARGVNGTMTAWGSAPKEHAVEVLKAEDRVSHFWEENIRFFDSHGGMWETCSADEESAEAFGPEGTARRVPWPETETPFHHYERYGKIQWVGEWPVLVR